MNSMFTAISDQDYAGQNPADDDFDEDAYCESLIVALEEAALGNDEDAMFNARVDAETAGINGLALDMAERRGFAAYRAATRESEEAA